MKNHVGLQVKFLFLIAKVCYLNLFQFFIPEKLEVWTFLYVPITIMLFINLILFLWSIWGLHKHGNDISLDKKKAMLYK